MKREDDQELWDLLGNAGQPTLSPFFARNVLRRIRQQPSWRERVAGWLTARRLIPAGAVAIAMVAATISLQRPGTASDSGDNLDDVVAQLDPVDYEVVADLDDLLAVEEDNLWSDGETSTL